MGNQWNWMFELFRWFFFVRFHIVCDRYTSDYDHFTFTDTIWPLLLSPDFGTQMITLAETASYAKYSNFYLFSCRLCLTKWANHKCVERTDIYWDKNLIFLGGPSHVDTTYISLWARSHPSWDVFRFKIFTEPFLWSRHPHLGNSVGGGFPII